MFQLPCTMVVYIPLLLFVVHIYGICFCRFPYIVMVDILRLCMCLVVSVCFDKPIVSFLVFSYNKLSHVLLN